MEPRQQAGTVTVTRAEADVVVFPGSLVGGAEELTPGVHPTPTQFNLTNQLCPGGVWDPGGQCHRERRNVPIGLHEDCRV